ncbi:MAG TPA: amidase [Anaeromyxobacteraceae bacterium]|nr:amidase [Anaeromyxobacteraceae bacterium]
MTPLHDLGAAEAVALLRSGRLSAEELARACLERIAAEEPRVGAFEHLDPAAVLDAARRADAAGPRPPLHGLPVAVKDIVDTSDLPTECGSPVHRGRRPGRDAACVARLRAAGAVILGKTVTTELAFYRPGKTRNPHDPGRTPGGSSSGSAAAVAASLVPAAIGTQTAGSVIRPASFCGVVGMKPTHGLVPMEGVLPFAPSLDTIGVFARDLAAVPLLLEAMGAPAAAPPRREPPRVALCRTEQWPLAEPATRDRVEEVARALARAGASVGELDLGRAFDGLAAAQRAIMAAEAARTFAAIRARHGDLLSPVLRDFLREGEEVGRGREAEAREQAARCREALGAHLSGLDVLLTPSAPGEAPRGLEATGDPAFNRIWTLLGVPCLSLPAGRGPAGLPVGVQLVGAAGADGALVASAAWIARALGLPC